jgi:hypothetical protein
MKRNRLAAVAAALLLPAQAWPETLTVTTTYPSPFGVYQQLVTTGRATTGTVNTTLARNAGNVLLAPPSNPDGRVGVGTTTPQATLDVNGGVKLGSASACGPASAGTLRWRAESRRVEACDGASWRAVGGAPILCRAQRDTTGPPGGYTVRFRAEDCGGTLPDAGYTAALKEIHVCNGVTSASALSAGETIGGSQPGPAVYFTTLGALCSFPTGGSLTVSALFIPN